MLSGLVGEGELPEKLGIKEYYVTSWRGVGLSAALGVPGIEMGVEKHKIFCRLYLFF